MVCGPYFKAYIEVIKTLPKDIMVLLASMVYSDPQPAGLQGLPRVPVNVARNPCLARGSLQKGF